MCSDHHVGPEGRAILSKTDALINESSFFGSDSEFALRPSTFTGFLRIEDGKVQTDNFIRGIALNLIGSGVPRSDHPLGI